MTPNVYKELFFFTFSLSTLLVFSKFFNWNLAGIFILSVFFYFQSVFFISCILSLFSLISAKTSFFLPILLVSSDISLERSDNPFIISIKSIETVNISPFSSPIAACAGFCNISYPVTSFIIVLVPLNTPQPLYLRNLIVASPKVTPTAASSSPGIGVNYLKLK